MSPNPREGLEAAARREEAWPAMPIAPLFTDGRHRLAAGEAARLAAALPHVAGQCDRPDAPYTRAVSTTPVPL